MAYMSQSTQANRVEMYQKGRVPSVFAPRTSTAGSRLEPHETYETEFEEDLSDFEEYSGRRSEDSSGKQSETTLSSFDELRTPSSNNYDGFNFHIEEPSMPKKSVEGPVGPHLFRVSQETSQDIDFYLSMSPPASPERSRAGPILQPPQQPIDFGAPSELRRSEVPLHSWTPAQVAEWMYETGFDEPMINLFFTNDISGAILMDIKYEDLKELGVTSFGYRHRLWNEIRSLKGRSLTSIPPTPVEEPCISPNPLKSYNHREATSTKCSTPDTPEGEYVRSPVGPRHTRRGRRSDDIISPAESASIVAIEQLLPKPHKCSKGENCSKWQKQQRKLARIATEFPIELQQITAAQASPTISRVGTASIVVPSIVASSDLLGPAQPSLRLEEEYLKAIQNRDPQENVRQFLNFQHLNHRDAPEEPTTPPYEMFPPLSPPQPQAPHSNLRSLPKLTIPNAPTLDTLPSSRTVVPQRRASPVTANYNPNSNFDIYRLGSPASEMDVPVTAIPDGPIERDFSSSVPPDMRFGGGEAISRSNSRMENRRPHVSFAVPPNQPFSPIKRSTSHVGNRPKPSFTMAPVRESVATHIEEELTPTIDNTEYAGWMKKRKTKMLRHEWQDNHFRLNGTRLAMHKDEKIANAIEYIDVDDYAVACSSLNNSKINSAFKRLQISGKKTEAPTFAFQLVPSAEKKGILNAATGKTHHFAVKTGNDRCDWMRELMLAKALKKQKGADLVHSQF